MHEAQSLSPQVLSQTDAEVTTTTEGDRGRVRSIDEQTQKQNHTKNESSTRQQPKRIPTISPKNIV